MERKRRTIFLLSAMMAGALTAPGAHAQEAEQGKGQVEEIIVTAQRRGEDMQSVPITITAVTGDTLSDASIKDISDLPQLVPGLDIPNRGGAPTPTLRGVGGMGGLFANDSPIAVYIDGVYQSGFIAPVFSFNNVRRVEVLKGPQGTLFGRNATGGVIQIITKQPQHEPSADLSLGYGNFDTLEGSFYGTAGVTERLAVDLAAYYRDQQDGWGRNLLDGEDVFKTRQLSLRNKWHLALGDDTEATLSLGYNRQKTSTSVNRALPGVTQADGSTYAGYYTVNLNLREWPQQVSQKSASLTLTHTMEWASLVSISAWQKYQQNLQSDLDSTALPLINSTGTINERTVTQELQLLSEGGSPVTWALGVYYLNSRGRLDPFQLTGAAFTPLAYLGVTSQLDTESFAGYGQATVPLSSTTRVTAGVRYTHDKRHIVGSQSVGISIPFVGLIDSPNCAPQPACPYDSKKNFGKLTYKIALDHNFTPDLMTYAQYSRGFKSGNFVLGNPGQAPIKPEILDAFEIGFKSEWLDRRLRLNASAFLYKYKNMEVASLDGFGNTIEVSAGRAEVTGADVDFEFVPVANLTLRGGAAYLDAEFTSFPDASTQIPNFPCCGNGPPTLVDASGNALPFSPKWTANLGMQYEIPTAAGRWGLSANYTYTGRRVAFDYSARLKLDAYSTASAALSWTSPDSRWKVKLWADNLFDEKYLSFAYVGTGDVGNPGAPRTYGITFSTHLGS